MTEDTQPLFHTHTHDGWTHTHMAREAQTAPDEDLRIRGVVLPDGEERELWVHDGVLVEGPLSESTPGIPGEGRKWGDGLRSGEARAPNNAGTMTVLGR